MTRYLILEGCHGTGTTTHADALAETLRGMLPRVWVYHHPPHPPGLDGVARVAWYAGARAQLVDVARDLSPGVVVMDRGPRSGLIYAAACGDAVAGAMAIDERDAEPWRSAPMVMLDAPDDVLDARIAARGEPVGPALAERGVWRATLGMVRRFMPPVRTDRPQAVVQAELLAWALRALEAP